jgi:hypothetical protein
MVSSAIRSNERALDVRGATVAALVDREDVEPVRQRADVVLEEAGVGQAAVQEHERLARSLLVIPGPHAPKVDVASHITSRGRASGSAALRPFSFALVFGSS